MCNHGLDEGVERLLALGLGRLDQQALRHQQREIRRRRVEAVVEQPLREIHGGDVQLPRLTLQRDDELVARAARRIRGIEARLLRSRASM